MTDRVLHGHRARKRFGQNFLHDSYIISQIVAAIHPQPDQFLVEIGPGLGALTGPVLQQAGALTVIELDRDLAERLLQHPEFMHKLTLYQADALRFDFRRLRGEDPRQLRIFGNLPYNISTPLMFHLFEYAEHIQDMHFMLQKEVVQRLAAGPGSKAYGRLSVMAQYFCDIIPVLEVPPESFRPAPKVDSAVVRLVPKVRRSIEAVSLRWLNRICTEGFSQRRKTIRNCFKQLLSSDELQQLGLDPGLRPENLTLEQFVLLANRLAQYHGPQAHKES